MRPLNLTDDELQDAAEAARVASELAEREAEKQSAVKVQSSLYSAARRFRELADKFERTRFGSLRSA